ncbi:TniB family NTP-binding protein [Enterovibrio paralichthyis]|uniref:TniB family NTP-binding protein n=1 Tax=Enterovibrio paralichthyis TaxID=2853805 RepID=UPI001C48F99F|nr:TniB family NTP-binding protein [Enterovibrio paralichthyis]MBV7297705.1 TniB family NTP-binding protein [Enterovibrio paralichthyis]
MNDKGSQYQKVKRIFICDSQINEILADIQECREDSDRISEPECMIVVGDSGSGKTTIIDKYLMDNPRKEGVDGSVIPILSTSLPANANPITASESLLSAMGDPFAFGRGRDPAELMKSVIDLLRECCVELIIIDEFQHMIDRRSKDVLHNVADWLKMIIIQSKVPVVLFGMPYSTVILDANHQLLGRFESQHHLQPFRVKKQEELTRYKTFLTLVDQALPFGNSSNLASEEMMKRIYVFSKGNMRLIRRLINKASKLALIDGSQHISLQHLSLAAPKVSRGACALVNPFIVDIKKLKVVEPPIDVGWENYLSSKIDDDRKFTPKEALG